MNQNNLLFAMSFAALFSIFLVFSTTAGVYAQTSSNMTNSQTSNNTMGMPMNDDMSMGSYVTNQKYNNTITSSVSIFQPIINAFKSMITVDINDAITAAQGAVGENTTTIAAFLHPEKHYIVYTVIILDSSGTPHKVLVDPGNGNVLKDEKTSFMKLMMLVHGGTSGMMGQGDMMGPEMGMMGQGNMMGPEMGMMGQGDMMGPEMGMMGQGNMMGPEMGMMGQGNMMGPEMGMMGQGNMMGPEMGMMGQGDAHNSWN
ncbi:MAG: PepSY domain-containing protein [Candidatus Nitrosocosmicus sp.]